MPVGYHFKAVWYFSALTSGDVIAAEASEQGKKSENESSSLFISSL
jgi:hypothetical protein